MLNAAYLGVMHNNEDGALIRKRSLTYLACLLVAPVFADPDSSVVEMENIELSDPKAIETAQQINGAFDAVTARVMACVDKNNGETAGCTCETREKCPFKEEFDAFVEVFCDALIIYPGWRTQNVSYLESEGAYGHTLGTANINAHYGVECR